MFKKLIGIITASPIWKSIFRRSYEDTPRNRTLAIMGNLFLHLHPVRVLRGAVKLKHTVPFGLLLRNIHRWAAHLMVITVMLHMFRAFMTGAYK